MSPWLSDRLLGSQSDERLVALACAGSDRAFSAIVQRYRRPLHAFARQLNANGEAEDLVQQTFLSALGAMRSGAEVRHLRGWLHQILRHAAMQASKRAALPAELEHVDSVTPSAQQAAELRMLTSEALAAVARLPARQHEALLATAVHGHSRAEAAQLLGLSEGAVRQLVHRARATLRSAVTAITPYPLARALAAGPSGGGAADVLAGAGAGSAAVAVKIGALLVSGVVATGIVASGVHPNSRSAHRGQGPAVVSAAATSREASHPIGGIRLADARGGNALTPPSRLRGGGPGLSRSDGAGSGGHGSDGGLRTGGGGSPGGPSSGSGSSDGGTINSGSPGGPSATTASSSDGGSMTTTSGSDGGSTGGSGSSDGGQATTTTATTTTTTTSGSSDGGSSNVSGSGDTTTTATTSGH